MKLYCLGTGQADVIENYNTCFVLENVEGRLLVDAGGGNRILNQLEKLNIEIDTLGFGVLTHCHTDHLLGYAWIIREGVLYDMLKNRPRENPFVLYGNKQCLNAVETICKITFSEKFFNALVENNFLVLKEVVDGQHEKICGLDVEFFDTRCVEKDFPQMGFFIKEKGFVFAGDVPISEELYEKFSSQKCLCLEAFCTEEKRSEFPIPLKKHRTVREASEIDQKLGAKNLILWHGEDDKDGTRKERYLTEAKSVYFGNVYAPNDLEIIEGL